MEKEFTEKDLTTEKRHYYVLKDGHCLSDFDDEDEARKYAKDVDGDLAIEE